MFSSLTENLSSLFNKLRGRVSINDVSKSIDELVEILRSSDVSEDVIESISNELKDFVGQKLNGINAGNLLIEKAHKIFIEHLSHKDHGFFIKKRVLILGLPGSGKTTMCGKISHRMKDKPLLVSLDTSRPAAREQLKMIADNTGSEFFSEGNTPIEIARNAVTKFSSQTIIFDTAGRMSNNKQLINEILQLIEIIKPDTIVFVADALYGQNIVQVISDFKDIPINYIAFSRVDSDTRGGAILSVTYSLKKPILLLGTGEKAKDSTLMDPKRIVDLILLDKGDIVALVEKMESVASKDNIDNDILSILNQMKKIGSLKSMISYLPGASSIMKHIPDSIDKDIDKVRAIMQSMTPKERKLPDIINNSRRQRIAKGSGTREEDVRKAVDMCKMLRALKGR